MLLQNKVNKLATLQDAWRDCARCPLSELRKQVVFGSGNMDAKLVLVGEAPGEQEDLVGQTFVGKAGQALNKLLELVGISRQDIWITNTCLCRPRFDKPGKNNRAPTSSEIKSCFPRLAEEINIIKPEIIVLAGNTPLFMATNKRGITKSRGWQDARWNGDGFTITKVYATLHPACLLYGSSQQKEDKWRWMQDDWLEIARSLSVKKENIKAAEESQS